LEGSVRKTGAWLHINAQLINTRTDAHVWAKQYDGDLKDLFAIQSQIAQEVARQLDVRVLPAEKEAIERPPTADLAAFNIYSQAKNLILAASYSGGARVNLLEAIDLLNQAVAQDPSFFPAYCQLARTHDLLYLYGVDHTPERLGLAEAAIQAAFHLRPNAAEAHLVLAENLYRGHLDYDGALAELEFARHRLPNDPDVFELMGYIQRRLGRWEDAVRNLERAIELNPRGLTVLQQMALSYAFLRQYREEQSMRRRILTVTPDEAEAEMALSLVGFHWKADTKSLHTRIGSIRSTNPLALRNIADTWLLCALAERDGAAATSAVIASGEHPFHDEGIHFNRAFTEGLIARMMRDENQARSAFAAARAEQEKIVQAQPAYGPALCVLGLIDAALGRKDEALREGRRAVELLPIEKDAINGALMIEYFAMIAAWVGDKDLACEQLAVAIRYPGPLSYGELKLLPFWDPLRGDPRFEKIVTSLVPKEG
jgi:tetratricopeptide (TPR) repeat protein